MKYTVRHVSIFGDSNPQESYNLTIATAQLMACGVGAFNIISEYDERGRLIGKEKWFVGARAPYATLTVEVEN